MVAGFNAVCEMSWAPWNYTLLGFRLMWPSRSIGVIRGEPLLHASWKLPRQSWNYFLSATCLDRSVRIGAWAGIAGSKSERRLWVQAV
jgi:hypothetical protein